ncbi:hypothetical protein MP228_002709 [Amoeboaphelidium protococcarum]|nr:hypothetical protein MP228_002709 [Amoeboaphelidium protococcarum]
MEQESDDKLYHYVCEKCHQPLQVTDEVVDPQLAGELQSKALRRSTSAGYSSRPISASMPTTDGQERLADQFKKISVQSKIKEIRDFNVQSAPDASFMILSPAPQDLLPTQRSSTQATHNTASAASSPFSQRKYGHSSQSSYNNNSGSQQSSANNSSSGKYSKSPKQSLKSPSKQPLFNTNSSNNNNEKRFIEASEADNLSSKHNVTLSSGDQLQWYERVQTVDQYLEMLAQDIEMDLPLCIDCYEAVERTLKRQLDNVEQELRLYESFQEVTNQDSVTQSNEEVDGDGERLSQEKSELDEQLKALQQQELELIRQLDELSVQTKACNEEEIQLWEELSRQNREFHQASQSHQTATDIHEFANRQLAKLKTTNVYDDVFHIWHRGPFGTINGFRLGKLNVDGPESEHFVDWAEINAALGQVCLLIDTLSRLIPYQFKKNKIVPMGSFSRIIHYESGNVVDDGKGGVVYELYGTGEFQLSRLFWVRRFDMGMIQVLACMKELEHVAASSDKQAKSASVFALPHKINQDLIGDVCIKLQYNEYEIWTRALKFMLTNLRWLLAYFCK